MANLMYRIPEEDRTCINCKFWDDCGEGDSETLCHGTMPCSNYHKDNEENFFEPDDSYLQWKFDCDSCIHEPGEPDEECLQCKRFYDDMWERKEDI